MNEPKSIPVPTVMRELIISNNQLLQNYQQELSARVNIANREMMQLLGLSQQDGWKLDTETMTYVKGEPLPTVSELKSNIE